MIEVVVAATTAVWRRGLAALLDGDRGISVVFEAGTVDELEEFLADRTPRAVVVSLDLDHGSGVAVCRRLAVAYPATAVVAVLGDANDANVRRALEAGARGLVAHDSDAATLQYAVRSAVAGGHFIDPRLGEIVVALVAKGRRVKGPFGLTVQEQRVARLLPRGLTNQQIADELGVSLETVKTHVRHVLAKLGARDRVEAAEIVLRENLTEGVNPPA